MDTTLIALAFIQLYVNIRFAIMGIETLTREVKEGEVGTDRTVQTSSAHMTVCCSHTVGSSNNPETCISAAVFRCQMC